MKCYCKVINCFEISRRENIWVEKSICVEGDVPYGTWYTEFFTVSTHIKFLTERKTKFKTKQVIKRNKPTQFVDFGMPGETGRMKEAEAYEAI